MQASHDRSSSSRPAGNRTIQGAGAGVVLVGLLFAIAGSGVLSCSPGVLDPNEPAFNVGGAGGGGSGGVAGSGGKGGMGGAAVVVTPATKVANCTDYPTVGDVETKLFPAAAACITGCHLPTGIAKALDLKAPDVWKRLVNVKAMDPQNKECVGKVVYIDPTDPENSFFVAKVRDAAPKCGASTMGGARMPFTKPDLNQAQIDCFIGYAKAVSGK